MVSSYSLGQTLYRAEAYITQTHLGPRGSLWYDPFTVVKVTPKGAWAMPETLAYKFDLEQNPKKQGARLILNCGRWCSPTKEEALERLKARSASHVKHSRRRLKDAEARYDYLHGKEPPEEAPTLKKLTWSTNASER